MDSKIRCKKCNSDQVYTRIKTNEIVCKKCGHIEKVKHG
jgi:transcription initiation factor TFIIIB Brf1 subunit/transcription initiation factor TFIIB